VFLIETRQLSLEVGTVTIEDRDVWMSGRRAAGFDVGLYDMSVLVEYQ
jgi:hypothetical protein